MSILSGASVSQLLALSSVPRGARMTRILSMRAGAVMGGVLSRKVTNRHCEERGDEAIQRPKGA